ncbi:MAG: porin family protein [Saprospiraceae bacterium]
MRYLLVLFISIFPVLIYAQEDGESLFRGGILGGFNASQLDGDSYRGYDKLGASVGLGVKYKLPGKKISLGMEILYNMRGSVESLKVNDIQDKIKLDYIDIPVWMAYREWNIDFQGGLFWGRLINVKTELLGLYEPENFKKIDVGLFLGATYHINDNFGASLRFTRSFINLMKKEANRNALLSHHLTIRVEYWF